MANNERLYKIERLIRNRGHVSFQTLLDELEVSRATLKRDLEYLRSRMGAPIDYDRALNGYRFAQNSRAPVHELPGLWFDERELYSLLMAHQLLSGLDGDGTLSRHLQPLLGRIHELLGSEDDSSNLLQRVKVITAAARPVPSRFFERVAESLLKRQRLQLRYLSRSRGETGQREVSPQRLVHYRNTWYLDAWCHRADGLRRFALDAIEDATALPTKARDIAKTKVQAEMDAGYGIYAGGTRQWATLVFSAQAATWTSRETWHAEQKSRWLPDGRYELQLPYVDDTELLMDLLRQGPDVQVLAPATLRERLKQRLHQALAAYR